MDDKQNPKDGAKKADEKARVQTEKKTGAGKEFDEQKEFIESADEKEIEADSVKVQVAALNERMLRIAAEYENFRKRTMKEKEELALNAKAAMLLKIIPMYEEVEMAAKEAEKAVKNANAIGENAKEGALGAKGAGNAKENAIATGVKMLAAKFGKMLAAEGVTRMQVLGKKFDPYLHDVVSHVESEKPLGEIVQIVQNGYNLNGKVLRHAVVIVSNGKGKAGGKTGEGNEGSTESAGEEEYEVDSCPSC